MLVIASRLTEAAEKGEIDLSGVSTASITYPNAVAMCTRLPFVPGMMPSIAKQNHRALLQALASKKASSDNKQFTNAEAAKTKAGKDWELWELLAW